jgi:hypothetical protein
VRKQATDPTTRQWSFVEPVACLRTRLLVCRIGKEADHARIEETTMPRLTLTVVARKHENAVNVDNPDVNNREIGFRVTATLTSSESVSQDLQITYPLEQYVRDEYWTETRDPNTGDWGAPEEEIGTWERDEFGKDDDRGIWDSNRTPTVFYDEPGFLGTGRRDGRALGRNTRLGQYKVEFAWEVRGPGGKKTGGLLPIVLVADPDDSNRITYYAWAAGQRVNLSGTQKLVVKTSFIW